ncbi:MAG: thermonuclease family protein [Aerococcaceae bacterium]|nr:thermonuclease family protein [Aerococcaceae bacterium]
MSKQFKMPRNRTEWLRLIVIAVIVLMAAIFYPEQTKQTPTRQHDAPSSEQVDGKRIPVKFVRVVDGDTIIVRYNQREQRVRYLMIDTPESVKEGIKEQPFGKESARRNKELLKSAGQIYLEFDKGPRTDDYDRLLAYVYADDLLVPEQLLLEGLASVAYVNPPNNTREAQFRDAQAKAKQQRLNIWSIDNYVKPNGKFNQQ